MPREYRIVRAVPAHAALLAARLRPGDAAEIEATGWSDGSRSAVEHCLRRSSVAGSIFVGREIGAMWGLEGTPLARFGIPWLLTAPPIERVKRAFLREARNEIRSMLAICPELRNVVDARYAKAIRFLLALGFSVGEPMRLGRTGVLFRSFCLKRSDETGLDLKDRSRRMHGPENVCHH